MSDRNTMNMIGESLLQYGMLTSSTVKLPVELLTAKEHERKYWEWRHQQLAKEIAEQMQSWLQQT